MGELDIEWKCGKCGKEYTCDEYNRLPSTKVVETDTNPREQHGYTSVCSCGYVFHRDKWRLQKILTLKAKMGKVKLRVSTVFLELNHFGMWYETMVFIEKSDFSITCYYQDRYVTKEEAIKGHENVIKSLKNKKFEITPNEFELKILI
jgi:hypothetical protein